MGHEDRNSVSQPGEKPVGMAVDFGDGDVRVAILYEKGSEVFQMVFQTSQTSCLSANHILGVNSPSDLLAPIAGVNNISVMPCIDACWSKPYQIPLYIRVNLGSET